MPTIKLDKQEIERLIKAHIELGNKAEAKKLSILWCCL